MRLPEHRSLSHLDGATVLSSLLVFNLLISYQ